MNERGFESIIEKTFYTSVRQVTDIFLSERVTKHVLQEEHKGQGEVEKKRYINCKIQENNSTRQLPTLRRVAVLGLTRNSISNKGFGLSYMMFSIAQQSETLKMS